MNCNPGQLIESVCIQKGLHCFGGKLRIGRERLIEREKYIIVYYDAVLSSAYIVRYVTTDDS